jgi:antitoxin component of MazEF toxin-antitoxin module
MGSTESPFVSRAVLATRGSTSLRVTIPQVVADILGLRAGDEVEWVVEPDHPVVRVVRRSASVGSGAPTDEASSPDTA